MAETNKRMLIFELAEISFALDLEHVVEVLENLDGLLDMNRSDLRHGIVAALDFRHTWIPAVDPTLQLALVSQFGLQDRVALVLRSSEGNWAILVDQVAQLMALEKLCPAEVPVLLKVNPGRSCHQVMLADRVPIVVFEPERFYGISQGGA